MADTRLDVVLTATDRASATLRLVDSEIKKIGTTSAAVSAQTAMIINPNALANFGRTTAEIEKLESAFGKMVQGPIFSSANRPLQALNEDYKLFAAMQAETAGTFQGAIALAQKVTGESTQASILAAKAVLDASSARVTLSKETQKQLDQMIDIEEKGITIPRSILNAAGLSQSQAALTSYTTSLGGMVAGFGLAAAGVAIVVGSFEVWDRIVSQTGEHVLEMQSVFRAGTFEESAKLVNKLTTEHELLNFRIEHGVPWYVKAKDTLSDLIQTVAGGTPRVAALAEGIDDLSKKFAVEMKIEAIKIESDAIKLQLTDLNQLIAQSLRGGDIPAAEGYFTEVFSGIRDQGINALALFDAERAKGRVKVMEMFRHDSVQQAAELLKFDENTAAARANVQEGFRQQEVAAYDKFYNVLEDVAASGHALEAKLIEANLKLTESKISAEMSILNAIRDRIPVEQALLVTQTLAKQLLDARLVAIREEAAEQIKAVQGADAAVKIAAIRTQAAIDSKAAEVDYGLTVKLAAIQAEKDIEASQVRSLQIRRLAGDASIQDEINFWNQRIGMYAAGTAKQDEAILKSLQLQKQLQQEAVTQFGVMLSAQSTLEKALNDGRTIDLEMIQKEYDELRTAAMKAFNDINAGLKGNDQLYKIGLQMYLQGEAGNNIGDDVRGVLEKIKAPLTATPLGLPARIDPKVNVNGQDIPLASLPGVTLAGTPLGINAKVKSSITINGKEIDVATFESGGAVMLNPTSPAILDAAVHMDPDSKKLLLDLTEFFGTTIDPAQFELKADPAIQKLFEEPPVLGIDPAQFGLFTRVLETWQKPFVSFDDTALNRLYEFFAGPKLIGIDSSQLMLFTLQLETLELPAIVFSDDVQTFLNQPFPEIRLDPEVLAQLGGLTLPEIGISPEALNLFARPVPEIGIDPAAFTLFGQLSTLTLPSVELAPAVSLLANQGIPDIGIEPSALSALNTAGDLQIGIDPNAVALFAGPGLQIGIDPAAVDIFAGEPPNIGLDPALLTLFAQGLPVIGLDPAAAPLLSGPPPMIGVEPAALTFFDQVNGLTIPSVELDPAVLLLVNQGLPSIQLGPNVLTQIDNIVLPDIEVDPAALALFGEEAPRIGIDPAAVALFAQEPPEIGIDPQAFTLYDQVAGLVLPSVELDPAVSALTAQGLPAIGLDPNLIGQINSLTLPEFTIDPIIPPLFAQAPPIIGIDPAAVLLYAQEPPVVGVDPAAFTLFNQIDALTLPAIGLDPALSAQISGLNLPEFGVDPAVLSLFGQAPPQIGIDPAAFTLFQQYSGLTLPTIDLSPSASTFLAQGVPDIGLDPNVLSQIGGLTLPDITLDPSVFSLIQGGVPQIGLNQEALNLLGTGGISIDLSVPGSLQTFLDSDFTIDVNIDESAFSLFSQPLDVTTNIDPILFTLFDQIQEPISIGLDPESNEAFASLSRLTDLGGFEIDLQLGAGFDTATQLVDEFTSHIVDQGAVIQEAIASGARDGLAEGVVDAIVDNLTEGIQRQLSDF